jgi:hypothetical protein
MDKHRMSAVHDKDLDVLLEGLGIRSKLRSGRLRCSICDSIVTPENLGALYYDSGQVRVLCNEIGCLDVFRLREGADR